MLRLFVMVMLLLYSDGQKNPNMWYNRSVIVHLFEWKFSDIATECETFLAPKGFGGVQVSPVHQHAYVANHPWWARYQTVSYKIKSSSGDEESFKSMVQRCNRAGVRIYVDFVLSHTSMTRGSTNETARLTPLKYSFPGVLYTTKDFSTFPCNLNKQKNETDMLGCQSVADHDEHKEQLRKVVVAAMNHLIDLGVAGFRIDAAKHILPPDLEIIYSRLKVLNREHGFEENAKPFIYQEVIDYGNGGISHLEYIGMGVVTEFRYSREIAKVFTKRDQLKHLVNWGAGWGFMANSNDALVFVDNHDNQRRPNTLTYKSAKAYKMASGFMLAHPYGHKRVMSSYGFCNFESGPPKETRDKLMSPQFDEDGACLTGWICEHRWRAIYNMVGFANAVQRTEVDNWWDDGNQQIAFSRGSKGFVAITLENDFQEYLQTGLPGGTYCDVITGKLEHNKCTGKEVIVSPNGMARIEIAFKDMDNILAIHVAQRKK